MRIFACLAALAFSVALPSCISPDPVLPSLPRPSRASISAQAVRAAALREAFDERLRISCMEDATLAALHARQDTAEQVIAVYTAQDSSGCATAALVQWVCADGGALVLQSFGASWTGGEWRLWRQGQLDRTEPPCRQRERKRAI